MLQNHWLKWKQRWFKVMSKNPKNLNLSSSADIQMHCPFYVLNIISILKGISSFKISLLCPHYSMSRWEDESITIDITFLIPCPWIRAIRALHNRVFRGESKWESVVNSIQDTEAVSPISFLKVILCLQLSLYPRIKLFEFWTHQHKTEDSLPIS